MPEKADLNVRVVRALQHLKRVGYKAQYALEHDVADSYVWALEYQALLAQRDLYEALFVSDELEDEDLA